MSAPNFRKKISPSKALIAKPGTRPSASGLWRSADASTSTQELPVLPVESLEALSSPCAVQEEKQRQALEETIGNLKTFLKQAHHSAILSRSQSMELPRRQELCQKAWEAYEAALELRETARRLSAVLSLEDRRRVRSLEGAPEWRSVKHAIRQAAELNRVRLSQAA